MKPWMVLIDRTAVLFLGVAAGAAIGLAFAYGGHPWPEQPTQPEVEAAAEPAPAPVPVEPAKPMPQVAGVECAMPFQQQLLDTLADGGKIRVGVFGDSFGDGLWSALYRQLPANANFQVVKYSQQSTGFTRYASLNIEEHTAQQLAADGPVDIAVISFGANDTQGVMAGAKAARLLSPEWKRVIGERIDGLVRLLRSRGAMVYWVGLPKMRKESFDADISAMNAFYADRMKMLGVPFIDTVPFSVDAGGAYAPYLPDGPEGKRTLIRANDGIHMSMTGYVRITRGLADRIRGYVEAARSFTAQGEPAVQQARAS
ncbi:GDSL-type esterase/lipase family protein [Sphingomonas sp. DBB INV C78]|uniref:SGNH/GDSL hydrolase family protein n=1 Tax=Sphingomonas sp. DBB INV C78 TaxID=3349434 RepID=UPI0036D40AD5